MKNFVIALLLFGVNARAITETEEFAQAPVVTNIQNPFKFTGSFWNVWSDHDTSKDYLLQGSYRTGENHEFYLGAERLSRAFENGPLLSDDRFMAGDVYKFTRDFYLENNLTLAKDPYFLPTLSIQTIPHYVLHNGSEVGLGMKFAHYPGGDVETYSPSYLYSITDDLLICGQVNAVQTHHTLGSVQGFIQTRILKDQTLRFTGAGGQSLEALNLEGRFRSFALSYRWRISSNWAIEPSVSDYRGTIRDEDSLGLTLEWRP